MLAVLFLFACLTFFGKNKNYELSTKEIRVNFGLLKKIAYNFIANAEIVDLKIILRIWLIVFPAFNGVHLKQASATSLFMQLNSAASLLKSP